MFKKLSIALALSLLAACSTTNVGLKYAPQAAVKKVANAGPAVTIGDFLDQREDASNWLGAIRGGYGNPLKNLEADRPVAEMVKAAFSEALRARGINIGEAGRNQITGVVKRLDCNQYVRREAYADIEIAVLDNTSQQRFVRTY